MPQVTKTQAIRNFLIVKTHEDLAMLYNYNMEVQVNVGQDGGERVEREFKGRRWQGWSDGLTTWKSFRVPFNAATNPEYKDFPMKFDLAQHAEGIGMTGWDWGERVSRWVAYDFDSIVGHSDGISIADLEDVQRVACEVPWVSVRKSTSGNGLHLYVSFATPPATENHNEHAALARAVLGQLAAETGYDFHNKVDICGGNMWVWHRKMEGTDGLTLLKRGVNLNTVPPNWRDHVKVVAGRRRKNLPQSIEDQEGTNEGIDDLFAELTGQYVRTALDAAHKKLFEWLKDNDCLWWWDQDNNMLVTHTIHLKDAHDQLNLRGIFNTSSTGKEKGVDHNCFGFPLRKGGWAVRRFTPGVREHDSWEQDGSGWTRCYLNMEPTLPTAARSKEGVEHPSGGYMFQLAEQAQSAALKLGADLSLPAYALSRPTKLKEHKDGRLSVEVDREQTDDPRGMTGWIPEGKKWKRLFNVTVSETMDNDTRNYDDLVRHLTTEDKDCGWAIRSENAWVAEPIVHVKLMLQASGISSKDVAGVLGDSVNRRWRIVNKPFEPEYPGDREWNREACQLQYFPSKSDDLHYPTWENLLSHVGQNLDEPLSRNSWAQSNSVKTGADYLKCWIASIFQEPKEPLPYLFLYGVEATGKSIFHEALSLLITSSGYKRAESALTNPSGFNGEIANAVICAVEEINLQERRNALALQRIKDWVTSPQILIHPKNITPYHAVNTTHWIQCANDMMFCPVFQGDTRITMIHVLPVPRAQWLNKRDIFNRLKKEASDFLGALMRLEIPEPSDRLNVPVITTSEKELLQKQNASAVEQFIDEQCHLAPGYIVKSADMHREFVKWLGPTDGADWSVTRFHRALPHPYYKGRAEGNQLHVCNISLTPPTETRTRLVSIGDKFIKAPS